MIYLNDLYAGASDGFIAIWHMHTRHTCWYSITDVASAASYMESEALNDSVYFGWGLQRKQLPSGRGKATGVVGIPGFMFDADLRSDTLNVHAKEDLPQSLDEVLEFLHEIEFPLPTQIRSSGNGLYLDWLLAEFWNFADDTDRKAAAALSKRLQKDLIKVAKRLRGWAFDNTSDLARVTRMPGTLNHKTTPPKPVELLYSEYGERYTVVELENALEAFENRHGAHRSKPSSNRDAKPEQPTSQTSSPEPNIASIENGCAWVQSCLANASSLPEPDWFALASVYGACPGGNDRFHELSAEDSRYDYEETAEKLRHATEDGGPRTCQNISEELDFEGCQGCPFFGRINSPIALGQLDENQAWLAGRYVFDVEACSYVNVADGTRLDQTQMDNKFQHLVTKGTPHSMLRSHKTTRKVDCSRYLPGVPSRFASVAGKDALNLWRDVGVAPEPSGDASIILEHLGYMFPNPEERDHLLDCFASVVQKPDEKVKHALVIAGSQGTGKTFLAKLLTMLVGHPNATEINSDLLMSEWTATYLDCQVLVIEELMTRGRKEAYNRIKPLLSEDEMPSNQKHERIRQAKTPRLVIALSNYSEPISVDSGDRRIWMVTGPDDPQAPEYYDRLFSKGLAQAGAFKNYLLKRDISGFASSAKPPMTEAKENLINCSLPTAEHDIKMLMEDGDPVFDRDLVSVDDVAQAISRVSPNAKVPHRRIQEALKANGAVSIGQVRLAPNHRRRLWAVRNTPYWVEASPEEVKRHLRGR